MIKTIKNDNNGNFKYFYNDIMKKNTFNFSIKSRLTGSSVTSNEAKVASEGSVCSNRN